MEVDAQIDLLESELLKVLEIGNDLTLKYQSKPATFENLTSLRHEAEDRFHKAGLEATVDTTGLLRADKQPVAIQIIGRRDDKPFDPDQMAYEVRKGIADEVWDKKRQRK